MDTKKNVLIIIFVLLVLASAALLYRSFSNRPLQIVTPTVSNRDVEIRSQVDSLKVKINKAIAEVEAGGSLDQLVQSTQFRELLDDSLRVITVGSSGRRNPFVPPSVSP